MKYSSIFERVLFEKLNGRVDDPQCIDRYGDPDKLYEIGRKYMEAYEKYGYLDWYDWSNANWGTKWNACDTYVYPERTGVDFETAWCYPEQVIAKIFADNPDQNIEFTWSNEEYDGTHTLYRNEEGFITQSDDWEDEYSEEYEE